MNFIILITILILTSGVVFAQTDVEIAEQCKSAHPTLSEIFKKNECVSIAKKNRAEIEARNKREEAARPCLAKQIPIMESTIRRLMIDILPTDSLDSATSKLEQATGNKSNLSPSENNIKNMVAINWLGTNCKSDFYYLINITQGEDGKLQSFKVWTDTPPRGYTNGNVNGYRPEFFVDFVSKRKLIERPKSPAQRIQSPLTRDSNSHCEPNLTRAERLEKLATNGEVFYSSPTTFRAGNHGFGLNKDNSLTYCF